MGRVIVFLSNGFEEVEVLTVVDYLQGEEKVEKLKKSILYKELYNIEINIIKATYLLDMYRVSIYNMCR